MRSAECRLVRHPCLLSLPVVAIDDAERRDDRHADEAGQSHDDPAVREASADDWSEEQRLAADRGVVRVVIGAHLLAQVHRARQALDEPRAAGQLCAAAHQEHPDTTIIMQASTGEGKLSNEIETEQGRVLEIGINAINACIFSWGTKGA